MWISHGVITNWAILGSFLNILRPFQGQGAEWDYFFFFLGGGGGHKISSVFGGMPDILDFLGVGIKSRCWVQACA